MFMLAVTLLASHALPGQEARRFPVDVGQVVEAGARRVGVADAADARGGAVGAAAGAEGEVAGRRSDSEIGAAVVGHLEVLAVQDGRRGAGGEGVVAGRVRRLGGAVGDRREGQAAHGLGVRVGRRIDAAGDLGVI